MMKKKTWSILIALLVSAGILLGSGFHKATASKEAHPKMVPANFTELAEKARPGVVNIRTVKTLGEGGPVYRHFFGNPFGKKNPFGPKNPFEDFFKPFPKSGPSPDFKQQSLGSGFILDRKGYIVTNNHVIDGADEIRVKLADGREFDAGVVGRDPKTDLAIIKIEASGDLIPLKMGRCEDLKVGTWVVAIGSPFGLEQTVTAGIVSGKGRVIGAGPYDDFIQTDASINPGNSGGPLLNLQGEVVGINTAIIANGQGIGFAIPVTLAKDIIGQLKNKGEVTRAWMGVGIQDLSPALAEYYQVEGKKGVLVTRVYPGDPADKAGIEPKDTIIAVDGQSVDSSRELSRIIANSSVGEEVGITLIRKGEKKTLSVRLARRVDSQGPVGKQEEQTEGLGLQVVELNPETAQRFGYGEEEKGLVVVKVKPDGKAGKAGIQQGDVIKEVNHTPIKTLNDYRKVMREAESGQTLQVLIKRANAGFIVVKIPR